MSFIRTLRQYLEGLSAHSVRLLAAGLLPVFFALGFILFAENAPSGSLFGETWLQKAFALWVDSIGVSLLLLVGGAALLDYAEKHDG